MTFHMEAHEDEQRTFFEKARIYLNLSEHYIETGDPSPFYIARGKGCSVWDIYGNAYIDLISGSLSIGLGYRYPAVDKAIKRQLKKGINFFPFDTLLEHELARLIKKHIPCAEAVTFSKSGSDAASCAIRFARYSTGKSHVAVCGFHGWHDWYTGSTEYGKGVPAEVQALTHTFIFNDIRSLERLLEQNRGEFAAIILEPMRFTDPLPNFLAEVKALARAHKALLIFDEIATGFRFSMGGAQKYFEVIPDMALLGKTMGNGMPISAVAGREEYMRHAAKTPHTSTCDKENLSFAAAIATVEEYEAKSAIQHFWKLGAYLQDETSKILNDAELGATMHVVGKPCLQEFKVLSSPLNPEAQIRRRVHKGLLREGILWDGRHNINFSHTRKDIDKVLSAYRKIFPNLKKDIESGSLRTRESIS